MRFPENDIIGLVGPAPRYDLGESVGPDLRLAELLGASDPTIGDLRLGYGTAEGDARLRQLVAGAHGVTAADVVITVGGMHALFLLAFVLCASGDEVVTTAPLFPLAGNVLRAAGADVRTLRLSFDLGYRLDPTALRACLSPRTKLVSLASPQNPSGVAVPLTILRDIVDQMAQICPQAYLLVDETYREATYGDALPASSAASLGPSVVVVASLSKCHGAPGLRIGWAITRDARLRRELILAKFNTVVSCSSVDEALAVNALEQRDRILAERRRRLAEGLGRVDRWTRLNGDIVEWVRPDAGALCCVRLKPAVFDDAAVARFYETLADVGVRVANGAWFGDEARVFRLGFGLLSRPDLETALGALTMSSRR